MNKEITNNEDQSIFEKFKHLDESGNEYWTAREMAKLLEYSEYRHFEPAIARAKEACKNSGQEIGYHFEDILEMIAIGKGGKRSVNSVKLSRYACYLIVQNADSSKEVVALGQTYFAVQTRLQELQQLKEYNSLETEEKKRLFLRDEMKKHNIQLAAAAKDAGVLQPWEYAVFQNHGYQGLYGGLGAKEIHKLQIKRNILLLVLNTESGLINDIMAGSHSSLQPQKPQALPYIRFSIAQ